MATSQNNDKKRKFEEIENYQKTSEKQVLTYEGLLLVAKLADSVPQKQIKDKNDIEFEFSVMTYNIWFEPIEMAARIDSIIRIIIEENYPDIIMLQEVIMQSYLILSQNCLLKYIYDFSEPGNYNYFTTMLIKKKMVRGQCPIVGSMEYGNTQMGRGVMFCTVDLNGKRICFGTTHLESVFGNPYSNKKIKEEQYKQALQCLKEESPNILLCGDFNWNDDQEGELDTNAENVQDVWLQLHKDNPGFTYDGKLNKMLWNRFQTRLDRILYSIEDVEAVECKMVGTNPIQNLTTTKKFKNREVNLPVLPSDHFGLLAKFKSCKKQEKILDENTTEE